jgi:hypothetical protein
VDQEPHVLWLSSVHVIIGVSIEMFATPKSKDWSNVTPKAKLAHWTTKAAECNSCGKGFACNAGRVRLHYIKCQSCPAELREWAKEREAAGDKRRKHTHTTKKLIKLLDEEVGTDMKQTIAGVFRGASNAKAVCGLGSVALWASSLTPRRKIL